MMNEETLKTLYFISVQIITYVFIRYKNEKHKKSMVLQKATLHTKSQNAE